MHSTPFKLRLISLFASTLLFSGGLFSQTTLFYENFEGATSAFTLNTSDVQSSPTTDNIWLINNTYDGGAGSAPCGFFTAAFDPLATPDQNPGVTGNARSKYMHINSKMVASAGITNCMYIDPSPFYTCLFQGKAFSKMTAAVSTAGYTDVSLSFYWLCLTNSKAFGEVYYSTDNGVNWILITAPRAKYFKEANWTSQTITDPNFDNQASLQFGFRFVSGYHGMSDSIKDPAFGVDEIKLVAALGAPSTLTQGYASTDVCAGATIQIPVSSTGSFTSANNYRVELSDAQGSFTSAIVIGSSQTSANSANVDAVIPANTPAGSGYRIRVVSTNPVLTSTASNPFAVKALPTEANLTTIQSSVCTGTGTTLTFEGSAGTLKWEKSTDGQNFALISGQTAVEYATGNLSQDTWYKVTVSNDCGELSTSNLKISIESTVIIPASQIPLGEIDLCVTKVTLTVPNGYTNVVWSNERTGNVINITQPGTYFATGISPGGCTGRTIDYTYTKSPDPIAGFTYTQPSGYTIQFDNTSQNGTTYYWTFGSDTSILENPSYDYPFDDTYPVTMVVTNSCGKDTMTMDVIVQKFVSVEDLPGMRDISVFPNPSSELLYVRMQKTSAAPATIALLDITGRILMQDRVAGQGQLIHTLEIQGIAAGTYLLRIQQEGAQATFRIQHQ